MAAQLRQEHICIARGAELALGGGVGISEVAAVGIGVRGHVLEAGGAGGRVEVREFDLGADDAGVGEPDGEHAVDEVGEGGNAVHEDPETREGCRGGEHTGWRELVCDIGGDGGEVYPQKIRVREKRSWAMLPAVSAVSIPATTISVKVEVKIRNVQTSKNIRPPRS